MTDISQNKVPVLPAIPPNIAKYLVEIALQDRAAAYLQVTAEGHLTSSGGDLKRYDLQAIAPGDCVCDTFYYLEGFFPLEFTEVMQHVQLDCGPVVDVHIIAIESEGSGWILVLDTTAEAERAQRLQQKGNDLSLLRQQYAKLLNQKISSLQKEEVVDKLMDRTAEVQQTISVLIIKFCGPHAEQLSVGNPSTLKAVNASLSFITQVIVEEGGLINHVLGGTAAAFFGLLPSKETAPQQAVFAAKRVIKRLMEKPPNYALAPFTAEEVAAEGEEVALRMAKRLGVGASITSGRAVAGIMHGQGSHRLNAVGDPIQKAAQMGQYIQPRTITIDRTTFEAIQLDRRGFQSVSAAASLLSEASEASRLPISLYRLTFEQL